jgi:hypothetical protein
VCLGASRYTLAVLAWCQQSAVAGMKPWRGLWPTSGAAPEKQGLAVLRRDREDRCGVLNGIGGTGGWPEVPQSVPARAGGHW